MTISHRLAFKRSTVLHFCPTRANLIMSVDEFRLTRRMGDGETMLCPKCGGYSPYNTAVCNRCGAKLIEALEDKEGRQKVRARSFYKYARKSGAQTKKAELIVKANNLVDRLLPDERKKKIVAAALCLLLAIIIFLIGCCAANSCGGCAQAGASGSDAVSGGTAAPPSEPINTVSGAETSDSDGLIFGWGDAPSGSDG